MCTIFHLTENFEGSIYPFTKGVGLLVKSQMFNFPGANSVICHFIHYLRGWMGEGAFDEDSNFGT